MVFKRRDRRPTWQVVANLVYPRGGWTRAAQYVKHRVRRLPDTPQKIARGIFAGVFVTFTPFFGLHFIVAMIVAKIIRGNILASLMATFVGNPLTFPAIGYVCLTFGSWILGRPSGPGENIGKKFVNAAHDLWYNFMAVFTPKVADWRSLWEFNHDVFFPYIVGGLVPGFILASASYYLALPVISAYQDRRKKALRAKLDQLKKKTTSAEDTG